MQKISEREYHNEVMPLNVEKRNTKSRKGKYYTHVEPKLIEIEGWARDGLIDKQIAHNLGVAYSTFRKYRDEHEALSAALKNGKEVVDRQVENALLKRALGYQFDEVTFEDGVETKIVRKEVQPDTTAQIFWLKNRKPADWRDRKELEHSGEMNLNHNPYAELTTEELRKIAEQDE